MADMLNFTSFEDVVLFVLGCVVLLVCVGCVYAFFRAVFLFIFSKGDDAKVKSAWNSIRYMIIGIFMTIMLLFLFPQALRILKIPGADNYSARAIFEEVGNILQGTTNMIIYVINYYPGFNGTPSFQSDLPPVSSTNYNL